MEKTYNYIGLSLGILIWLFYFYIGAYDFFATSFEETYFREFWGVLFGRVSDGLTFFLWFILQVFFLFNIFYLRRDFGKIIKKLHNKI